MVVFLHDLVQNYSFMTVSINRNLSINKYTYANAQRIIGLVFRIILRILGLSYCLHTKRMTQYFKK